MKKIDTAAFYTEDSEWMRKDGEFYKIGISDFAQYIYGKIMMVSLPSKGTFLKKGMVVCYLETHKALSEVFMPVDGEIIKVNNSIINNPRLINESPYDEGWLALVKTSNLDQLKSLMTAEEYREYIGELFNKKK